MWVGCAARLEFFTNAERILVVKRKNKRPLRRSRFMWENNVKEDIREIWFGLFWFTI
jgi:hypothetical protein